MSLPCPHCHASMRPESSHCDVCGGDAHAELLTEDQTRCPSCEGVNTISAEYCIQCGAPMAVITRVVDLHRHNERGPLETWRVWGVETNQVGRERSMGLLKQWHTQCIANQEPTFVSVQGASGLGKSRLIAEYKRMLDAQFSETVMVQTECRDMSGSPLSVFTSLIKRRFYIAQQERPLTARRLLHEAIGAIMANAPQATHIEEMVARLMDLSAEDDAPVGEIDSQSFAALSRLLEADARRSPLMLVFEDVQYAPEATLKLLKYLQTNLSAAPILVVMTWSEEDLYAPGTLTEIDFDHNLMLHPLADEETQALILDVLRRVDDVPSVLIDKIIASAHGNPLAVEETLRLLIGEDIIDTREDQWMVHDAQLSKLKLPRTVEAVVIARIEALDEHEREVLSMASCAGQVVWEKLMLCLQRARTTRAAMSELWDDRSDVARLNALLESLERKDMLRRREDSSIAGEQEWYFKHKLEQRAAYELLTPSVRQRCHRVIAQWVESQGPSEPNERTGYIATQYDEGRCLDRAATRYIDAARFARRRYANRRAIELFTRGLSYLSDADIALKLQALHDLGSAYDVMGEHDQALAYYREMLRHAWMIDDKNKGGAAYNKIGRAYRTLGEFEDALVYLSKSLDLFTQVQDQPGVASTLDEIGRVHAIRGRFQEALDHHRRALALREDLEDVRSVALSLNNIGGIYLQRGEFKEAMAAMRKALELRRQVDDRQGVAESFNNLGILCLERGENTQAITLYKEALTITEELGFRSMQSMVLNNLGEALVLEHRLDEAKPMLEQALEVAQESGDKRTMFDTRRNLGLIALKQMQRAVAIEHMERSLEIAEELDAYTLRGIGYQNMAEIHAHYVFDPEHKEQSGHLARGYYTQAIELLERSGNEYQLGHCLSSYGNHLIEAEQPVKGRQQLERASDIFKRLEMTTFLKATEQTINRL